MVADSMICPNCGSDRTWLATVDRRVRSCYACFHWYYVQPYEDAEAERLAYNTHRE